MVDKIDSNSTGLSYAEETAPKTLSGSDIWYPLEPNSYDDFGPEYTKIPRRPIGPSRSKRKGVTAGLEAKAGWNQDLTFSNLTRLLQGFFFADIREKHTTKPMNSPQIDIDTIATSDDSYAVASGMPAFAEGDLVYVTGATIAGNNGLKVVASQTSTKVLVTTNLTDESPANNTVVIKKVGYQFDVSTVDVTMNGNYMRLTRVSGAVDYTLLGLIVGEWIHIGGAAGTNYANNVGFARVRSTHASYIEFDKTTFTPTAETGTGDTINIFMGDIIRNEIDPDDIIARSYQIERTLGDDGVDIQAEYVTGAYANELTISFPEEDKVNVDLSFMALGHEKNTGTMDVKAGTHIDADLEEAFNTTVDTTRFRMSVDNGDGSFTPLFSYATEAEITIANNVSINKALTVFGGFEATPGLFEVGGDINAYFTSVSAVQAVEDNSDIAMDIWIIRDNKCLMFDIPLLTLGDGKLKVEIDTPVMLPLSNEASESEAGPSLQFQSFAYVPDSAI